MSGPDSERPEWDPSRYAIAGLQALKDFLTVLTRDYPATVERLRRENHGQDGKRVAALRLLKDEYTVAVNNRVNELVSAYLSEGTRLEARETLGRLRPRDREHLVPPAAWQLLEAECDAYDYEWIARLLDELGLDDALPELARRALASDDPEIRRVGERVRQEFPPHSGEPGGQQSR